MDRELTIADVIAKRVLAVPPDMPPEECRALLASGEWDALAVSVQGRWGYIAAGNCCDKEGDSPEAIADFALVVRDESFLSRTVAGEVPLLVGWSVMVFAEGKPVALHTPNSFIETLVRLLREQQVITTTVLDTVSEAVTVIDTTSRVIAWNSRAEQLYGFAAKEILGKPISEFFTNLVVTEIMQEPQAVKDKYHRPREGTHVLINAASLELDGAVIGGVSAERDITELVNLNRELSRASQEVLSLKEEIGKISQGDSFTSICGHSAEILDAVNMSRRIAAAGVPVLIRGESGTGKEVFARAIHTASRRSGPFVDINCGAIPANLFESELFGYQPGAFTGADRKGKPGLFETADGGTLFLDEIGELPKEMQVKLLRVLQDKSFYRIGGDRAISVDVRIIAATHRNLEEMIAGRDFRDDLYYRLNVVSLQLPPLRDRRGDIPELVHKGLQRFGSVYGKQINRVEPAVMAAFLDYDWPGNVRELHNVLERLVVLADGDILGIANLPATLRPSHRLSNRPVADGANLELATDSMARDLIETVLQAVGFNKAAAAKKLGIPRSTLYYKMNHLGINDEKLTQTSKN